MRRPRLSGRRLRRKALAQLEPERLFPGGRSDRGGKHRFLVQHAVAGANLDFDGADICRREICSSARYGDQNGDIGPGLQVSRQFAHPSTCQRLGTASVPTCCILPSISAKAETRKDPRMAPRLIPATWTRCTGAAATAAIGIAAWSSREPRP
jgi:hypothetical protein